MLEVRFFWINPIDTTLIQESWEEAFGRTIPDSNWDNIWRWRFLSNPNCEKVLAAYIIENGMVACFYAVSTMIIIHPDGKLIKSGLMNMGFTHPKFQGRGYYLEINKLLHEQLQSMGYVFLFGFANHNSHYSYRKYLGWKDLALLTNFRLLRASASHSLFDCNELQTELVELNEQTLDCLGNCFVTKERYHVQRSTPFLTWRLKDNPSDKYSCISTSINGHILGYIVFKQFGDGEADIMEIFYETEDLIASSSIISSGISWLLNKGYCTINLWSSLFSDEHLVLEKLGFKEHIVSTHFGVIDFSNSNGLCSILNWHYRFLDSDVY